MLLYALLACLPQGPLPAPTSSSGPSPSGPSPAAAPAQAPREASADRDSWFAPDQAAACSAAAERGLQWLASRQTDAGCWTGLVGHKMNDDYVELPAGMPLSQQQRTGHGHLGVTAFCGMAFLAGGHLPDRGQYGKQVRATLDYVLQHGLESGLLSDAGTRMYGHAFGTLFLAEIYGMAGTGAARLALERAVNLIVDSQNQHGGWRYNPFDREIDLSVTVCQVQALRAARNIGIRVPAETIDRAIDYVRQSRVRSGRYQGLFYYKIHGRGAYDKPNEYAINAAALTALSSAGIHSDDLSDPVLRFLETDYAGLVDYSSDHYYYWYGNYYAAQAFYQSGGAACRRFFARLSDDLMRMQRANGSWPNRVGPGDEWSTAIACILLQMPKQYLPIFQR